MQTIVLYNELTKIRGICKDAVECLGNGKLPPSERMNTVKSMLQILTEQTICLIEATQNTGVDHIKLLVE